MSSCYYGYVGLAAQKQYFCVLDSSVLLKVYIMIPGSNY